MSDSTSPADIIRTELRTTASVACGDPSRFGLAFQEMERRFGDLPMRSALIVDYAALAMPSPALLSPPDETLASILNSLGDRVQSISLIHTMAGKESRTVIVLAPPAAPP